MPRFDGHELSPKKGLNHDEEEGNRGKARQYAAAFKDKAVRMWLASGQASEGTPSALGVSVFQLYEWREGVSQVTRAAGAAGLPESKDALQLEVLRLR